MDCQKLERQLSEHLALDHRPVAVAFLDAAPASIPKFTGAVASGCSFWRLASEGRSFYTVPSDHYNCAIGAYTHNIPLPPDRSHELSDTLGLMSSIGYLRMEEVPGIPHLASTPAAIVYAPLGESPVEPDVVLIVGQPGRLMLLHEAAIRAGISVQLNVLARPTCMALPAALTSGVNASMGCVGNRVYTGVGEGDLYVVLPAAVLPRVAEEAQTIATANTTLLAYHQERRNRLAVV